MTQLDAAAGLSAREESDLNLLTSIGCADIDRDQAERALEMLHGRYAKLLKAVAAKWERYGVDSDVLVQITFLRAWEKADLFDPRKRYPGTPEAQAVKLWLLAILKHALLDEIRRLGRRLDTKLVEPEALDSERGDISPTDEDEAESMAEDDDAVGSVSEPDAANEETPGGGDEVDNKRSIATEGRQVKLVREWLSQQTIGDQDILRVSAQYIDFRDGRCVIPAEDLSGLAAMLGVLPDTIKVKRGRLLLRLKTFLIKNR